MEVTILESNNVPDKPVVAVQVGSSPLRQAGLQVGKPIMVPRVGDGQQLPVEVCLFNQLASGALPDGKEETDYSIPVSINGAKKEVKLRVTRTPGAEGETIPESPSLLGETDRRLGEEYLDRHDLQVRIQGLVEEVLKEQPGDPFKYMLSLLRKCKEHGTHLPEKAPLDTSTTPEPSRLPTMSPIPSCGRASPEGEVAAAKEHGTHLPEKAPLDTSTTPEPSRLPTMSPNPSCGRASPAEEVAAAKKEAIYPQVVAPIAPAGPPPSKKAPNRTFKVAAEASPAKLCIPQSEYGVKAGMSPRQLSAASCMRGVYSRTSLEVTTSGRQMARDSARAALDLSYKASSMESLTQLAVSPEPLPLS
eukprot:TRINITY_DN9131_c0_g1_i2.p1 TRINITY_DN9131_c0_g1~~TRINITY_DN9131_c0_g1_i2.p1  ORF type:complete len:361 (-),score=65.85 TRINITY_DN9131_c0_g1_i2:131-1213(-)